MSPSNSRALNLVVRIYDNQIKISFGFMQLHMIMYFLKGIVPLHIQLITPNESTYAHVLDEVWGMANEVK